MFVVVWHFEIAEEKVAAFEAAYGPAGAWAQLFRASPNYLGTELLRDAYIPGSYLTIDRWASEEDFRAFRKDHDPEYESLDRTCDASPAAKPASAHTPSEPVVTKVGGFQQYTQFLRFFAIFCCQSLCIPATIPSKSKSGRCVFLLRNHEMRRASQSRSPPMAIADDRAKAVEIALAQIEKQFGKGSICPARLKEALVPIAVISTAPQL